MEHSSESDYTKAIKGGNDDGLSSKANLDNQLKDQKISELMTEIERLKANLPSSEKIVITDTLKEFGGK